jgi:GTP-binding protein HflX
MANKVTGNTRSLNPSQIDSVNKLYSRKLDKSALVSIDFAREIYFLAEKLSRRIGVLVDREGRIQEVFLGSKEILYIPDLGRYRLGKNRFRRLRLIYSCLVKNAEEAILPNDILVDLEKLRFDAVIAVKQLPNRLTASYAYNLPFLKDSDSFYQIEKIKDLTNFNFDFSSFIQNLENQHLSQAPVLSEDNDENALLIGVYNKSEEESKISINELKELAKAANVNIMDSFVQRRKPDPKTLLGKGKLEEIVLQALRYGAEMLIFDSELSPSQWKSITNATDLKVIDRSMLILDIFARRAQSSMGKLQVEFAQLKYNLPRMAEKGAGLSRLAGGIGGRGPGETKLEIGRRRLRDRLIVLENRLKDLTLNRDQNSEKRKSQKLKQVSLLGYTNVGKSTFFNALTNSDVIVEDMLFATLDSTHRKLFLGYKEGEFKPESAIITDTVGFIRDLPEELSQAFKATLDELYAASLLLHVIDASDKLFVKKIKAVNKILTTMDLLSTKTIIVVNKIDLASKENLELVTNYLSEHDAEYILVSALNKTGLDDFRVRILNSL